MVFGEKGTVFLFLLLGLRLLFLLLLLLLVFAFISTWWRLGLSRSH